MTERTELLVAKALITWPSPSEGPTREQIGWKQHTKNTTTTTQILGLPQQLKQRFPHYMIDGGFSKAGFVIEKIPNNILNPKVPSRIIEAAPQAYNYVEIYTI